MNEIAKKFFAALAQLRDKFSVLIALTGLIVIIMGVCIIQIIISTPGFPDYYKLLLFTLIVILLFTLLFVILYLVYKLIKYENSKTNIDEQFNAINETNNNLPASKSSLNDDCKYIERTSDRRVHDCLKYNGQMIVIKGTKGSGKTSLIKHTINKLCKEHKLYDPIYIDFKELRYLDESSSPDINSLWKNILHTIDTNYVFKKWNEQDCMENVVDFFNTNIFPKGEKLLICFDNVDRLFTFSFKNDFFSHLRSIYNKKASDENWEYLNWILCISSEPKLFINNTLESPFDNIIQKISLENFTISELADIVKKNRINISSSDIKEIMDYTDGKPNLVDEIINELKCNGGKIKEILTLDKLSNMFKPYLLHYLNFLIKEENKDIAKVFGMIINNRPLEELNLSINNIYKLTEGLIASGLIIKQASKYHISCKLFKEYFSINLCEKLK
jgi:hypothetical protein